MLTKLSHVKSLMLKLPLFSLQIVKMSAEQAPSCPLCRKELRSEDRVDIGRKGADGINKASVERGDDLTVAAGTGVHRYCRMNYVNKRNIEKQES